MSWGAACGPDTNPGLSDDGTEWSRVNALLTAQPWTYRRSYQSGTESSVPSQPVGATSFRSMKPNLTSLAAGTLDTLIEAWIGSMANGALATIQHEPDNPTKGISAATFDAGFNRFATVAKATNPLVLIGPVVMEFQLRKQGAGYAYGKTINPSNIDFWGFDTYADYDTAVRSFQACCSTALTYFNTIATGKLFVIGETGIHDVAAHTGNGYTIGDPIDRPQWIYDGWSWAHGRGDVIMCYYNVNTDSNAWKLSDDETDSLETLLAGGSGGGGDVTTTYFEETFIGGTNGGTVTTSNTGFDLISGTAPTFTTDAFEPGALAMHVVVGGTAGISSGRAELGAVHSPVFVNYQIKATTAWPAGLWFPHVLRSGATIRADCRMPAGKPTIRNATTAVYTAPISLNPDVWYTVEHKIDNAASHQSITVWDNTGTIVIASGDQTYNTGTVDNTVFGNATSIASINVTIGHIRIADSSLGPVDLATDWDATAAPTVTTTFAAGGTAIRKAAATPTVTTTASATGHDTRKAVATPTVTTTLAAAAHDTRPAAATPTVTASLATSPTSTGSHAGAVTPTVTTTATPAGNATRKAVAAPAVTTTLVPSAHRIRQAAAAFGVATTATAAGKRTAFPTCPATITATLIASSNKHAAGAAAATVLAELAAIAHGISGSTRDLAITIGEPYTAWQINPPRLGWNTSSPRTGWTTSPART